MSRKLLMRNTALSGSFIILATAAIAAAPEAGYKIGNQAAATYESGGQSFSVDSNLVETTVNAVYGVDIEANQAKTSAPGNFVYFTHVITNTGNEDDTFTLTTDDSGAIDFNLTNIQIYADADTDGSPDNLTAITATPVMAAGETYSIIIRVDVDAVTAADGESATFDVDVQSQGDGTQTDSVTDTINISTGGTITLGKSQSIENDTAPLGTYNVGDTVKVVIDYDNTGFSDATNVVISDTLPTVNNDGEAITLTYVNSVTYPALWSDSTTTLTDADDANELTNGQGDSIDYQASGGVVTANLDSVPAGKTGTVEFYYTITAAEEGTFTNVATVTTDSQTTPESSNGANITIAETISMVLADSSATSAGGPNVGDDTAANLDGVTSSSTDDGAATDDVVEEATDVYPGEEVSFNVVLTNLGDVQDTFVLSVANTAHTGATTFPTGTTFSIVQSDGTTPLVGNQTTLAAGAVQNYFVIAKLPVSAAAATTTDYEATVTATSSSDTSVTNEAGLIFTGDVLAGTADLTDTTGGGNDGVGIGNVDNGGSAWETQNTNPGVPVTFDMNITIPAGQPANSFDLNAYADAGLSAALPAGWVVEFFDGAGNPISNTGTLTPTAGSPASFDFTVRVTPPANASATGLTPQDIYVEASSPTNGASDAIYYNVGVNELVDVSITTDTSVQLSDGGIVTIPHTVSNNGNSTITAGAIALASAAGAANELDGLPDDPFTDSGMTANLFYDNGDGVFGAGDVAVTNISDFNGGAGLAPGASALIFVRVQAPVGISAGTIETGDVAVSLSLTSDVGGAVTDSDASNNEVTDDIEVISGDLVLSKRQGVDANCDGDLVDAGDTALTAAAISADPGQCLVYEIVAENTGSQPATVVQITDSTPAFTSMEYCAADVCAPEYLEPSLGGTPATPPVVPADEGTGSVATPVAGFTLGSGETATLTFTVEIDQ